MDKTRIFFVELVQEITAEVRLPLFFWLFIELISNLQILSLVLLPLLSNPPFATNTLSSSINYLLYNLEPFIIFDPFESEAAVIIILVLCAFYFVCYFLLFGCIISNKVSLKNLKKEFACKTMSIVTVIHSKIIFYFIHCFTMKAMNNDRRFCSHPTSFGCTVERIMIPAILFVINLFVTLFQEIFCYQIHQNRHPNGIKNNLHHFAKFSHKLVIIAFFYFFQEAPKVLIFFTVAFTILDLFILHSRLAFYDLRMLRFSVGFSTISAYCAILTISLFWTTGENLCLIMICTAPLIIKISLAKLRTTLWNIFSFKSQSPFHVTHLPCLIENHFKENSVYPLPNTFTNATLYSLGFIAGDLDKIAAVLQQPQEGAKEVHKACYTRVIEEMVRVMQKHPNNELLSLSFAQIYSQVFEDSFKALDIIHKIADKNQSFTGRVSLQVIMKELNLLNHDMSQAGGNQKEKNQSSHLSYFAYRHKTIVFKMCMKQEIEDHLKLWKIFSSNELDVLNIIRHASKISPHALNINDYWHRNFEGYEVVYVNASLMYGLYLEIVHSIPYGGAAFIKKAYSSINNKCHIYKDVMDVIVGNSAVIVASIEPDKIGRVIDASSSVKSLFKTTKQSLIGSNIGMVLPSIVAAKHNDLIRGYQKFFTENINHSLTSYAKTLQDEYFRAQVTLHVSPLTHKGLNLVSYIKKISDYQSLMIIDPKGNIVECSKDLSISLNLFTKRDYMKIETLCPSFKMINQAFARLFKSNDYDDENGGQMTAKQTPKISPFAVNNTQEQLPPMSPGDRQRLLSSNDDDDRLFKSFRGGNEAPLSVAQRKITTEIPSAPGDVTIEEAQEIWEAFKNIQELSYFPYDKNSSEKHKTPEIKYKTEIEPFFFDRKWYKIIRIKNLYSHHERTGSHDLMAQDDFAEDFPSEDEKTENGYAPEAKRTEFIKKDPRYLTTQFISLLKKSQSLSDKVRTSDNNLDPHQINIKRYSHKSKSIVTSQASQNLTSQRLTNSLKIEKQSPNSRLVIHLVYFAIIVIIISICVHLIYTKNSLNQMRSSIILTQSLNNRLSKTIMNWQAMLVLYSRAVKLRPIDYKVPQFQAVTISECMDVLENAKNIAEELDSFQKKEIVISLYAKTVSFWEPLDGTLFNEHAIDQFSANQILVAYYLDLAKYKGSYLNLNGSREFLFSINNTANDYFLTLDRSIEEFSGFFTDTKDTNVKLLKVITAIEILSILSPLILIFAILYIIVKTYSQLFQAICKINDQSLANRVKQLEDISRLFEESLEDEISCFQKFKSQGIAIKSFQKKMPAVNYSRMFKMKSLTMYLLRYILVAACLIIIIIVLVAVSLQKSTQDLGELETINKKVLAVFNVTSQIRAVQPSFYVSIMFYNDTRYKIRNNPPESQLKLDLKAVDNINNILLTTLADSHGDISDPVIKDILNGNVCKYVTIPNQSYCVYGTKGNSYGLLGLNDFYSQICDAVRSFLNATKPTFALGNTLTGQYATLNNNTHFALFDVYDYLTNYLVGTFIDATAEDKNVMQTIFYENITVVLVSMLLIRVFVITKLQAFDMGIRRILRIIPYKIIEENKVMSFYLARTFQDELKVLEQLG